MNETRENADDQAANDAKILKEGINVVNLKLSGPVSLANGKTLGAELNSLIAYYNTQLGRTDPNHPDKIKASTGQPANQ